MLPYKIAGALYFTINLYVELDIRYLASLDIRSDIGYPAFRLARYLAGRISSQISIRCIPSKNNGGQKLKDYKCVHLVIIKKLF
jgi:hypothetical protein